MFDTVLYLEWIRFYKIVKLEIIHPNSPYKIFENSSEILTLSKMDKFIFNTDLLQPNKCLRP